MAGLVLINAKTFIIVIVCVCVCERVCVCSFVCERETLNYFSKFLLSLERLLNERVRTPWKGGGGGEVGKQLSDSD